MPDFFVPGIEYSNPGGHFNANANRSKSRDAIRKATSGVDIASTLASLNKMINSEWVAKLGAIYQFTLKTGPLSLSHTVDDRVADGGEHVLHVDLKTGKGGAAEGPSPTTPTVYFSMREEDFTKMFSGEMNPTKAFISGQLKINGDMQKAMALESLIKQLNKSKL